MSDFDPFGDAPAGRPLGNEPRPHWEQSERDFDPWADERDEPVRHVAGATAVRAGWPAVPQPLSAPAPDSVGDPETAPEEVTGRILVVCTGNVCRSPYMERVLRHDLAGVGIAVESAGVGALVGEPIDAGSVALLEAAAISTEGFAARQLTPAMVDDADLVLTATRAHRRDVVQLAPAGLGKTFALIDFADLVEGLPARDVAEAPGQNRVAQLVAAAGARRAEVPARQDEGADVIDPFRQDASVFEQMQAQLDGPLQTVTGLFRSAAR